MSGMFRESCCFHGVGNISWCCGHTTPRSGNRIVRDTNLRPSPPRQIPARRGWSGPGWHPGGVRGHGARWGAHRPHPALWYTPLPGSVAQPALQTRRDQRAPHRAIAAERDTNGYISSGPVDTQKPTNRKSNRPTWDQETVKQHKAAAC